MTDNTCLIERSSVREILITANTLGNEDTAELLREVDQLPISTLAEKDAEIERLRAVAERVAAAGIGGVLSGMEGMQHLAAENGRMREALVQVRGFAKVMSADNWRDIQLHIERQCAALDNEQTTKES